MKKFYLSLFLTLTFIFGFNDAWATHGTLQIVNFGKTTKAPNGDWVNGIGTTGAFYTISIIDFVKLIDEYNGKLTLKYDNFVFQGNLNIAVSGDYNVDLTFITSNSQNSSIAFDEVGKITVTANNGYHSKITFGTAAYQNTGMIDADEVIFTDEVFDYERIEMNGFKNWTQTEIDNLISKSSRRGNSITEMKNGKRAYDFTYYTNYKIDNGVFCMQATVDFLEGYGIGFKNLDRPGLLSNGISMSAYPAQFFCDLSKAEGIRFKVSVTDGSVESLNIGLSNQKSPCNYEYFIYEIPLSAADENGYITLPFGLFEPEYGSAENWNFSNIEVFSIEAINVTKGTTISFSDVHGYSYKNIHSDKLSLCSIYRTNSKQTTTIRATNEITQNSETCVLYVQGQLNLECAGKIALPSQSNSFVDNVNITANAVDINVKKSYASNKTHFNFIPLENFKIKNVYLDNEELGILSEYDLIYTDNNTHNLKITFELDRNFSIKIDGPTDLCEGEEATFSAQSNAQSYAWYLNGEKVSEEDIFNLPDTMNADTYELVLNSQIAYQKEEVLSTSDTLIFTIWPKYEITIQDSVIIGEKYTKHGFDLTPTESGLKQHIQELTTAHGCDSIIKLNLFVIDATPITILGKDEFCEGEEETLTAEGTAQSYIWYLDNNVVSTTKELTIPSTYAAGVYDFVLKTQAQIETFLHNTCDTFTVHIWAKGNTVLSDTINLGETYSKNGFDITPTEVGTANYYDTLVNAHGCDSVITLQLTTRPQGSGIHSFGEQQITVYPNPAHQNIHIVTDETMNSHHLFLFDLQGRLVLAQEITDSDLLLNIETLDSGLYLLKIDDQTIKIIKQ